MGCSHRTPPHPQACVHLPLYCHFGQRELRAHDRAASLPRRRRHHRRRHRRLLDRLSSDQARHHRRRAAGAQAAHLRHDLACGRAGRPAARDAATDRARQVHLRAARTPGGRDRAGDRVQAERLDQPRPQRRAVRGTEARRLDGQELRPRGRGDRAGRDQGALPAARGRRRGRRRVPAQGRPGQPDRHHPGLRQGRPPARRPDRRGRQGRAHPGRAGQGGRRDDRRGPVAASTVVLAAGMWSRELAAAVGVSVPLHAAEHFYIVTEPMAEVPRDLPVLRVTDECTYYKEDAGKLLVGAFEPVAKPWGMDGIPEDVLLRHAARGHGSFRADPRSSHVGACRCWPPPASRPSSTARRASPRTTATCSARPPRCATCSSPAASTRSASRARAAPARSSPNGSATGRPPST